MNQEADIQKSEEIFLLKRNPTYGLYYLVSKQNSVSYTREDEIELLTGKCSMQHHMIRLT